jgi:hypothetical protein
MGREFLISTFPQFDMTKERRAELLDTVMEETIGKLEEFRELHYPEGDDRDRLDVAREIVEDAEDCCTKYSSRDHASMTTADRDGRLYWINITGGSSWGDAPTEMFETMQRANHFTSVWVKCEQYAKEDYKPLLS